MQNVFILQEDSKMREVLDNTYDELLSALKRRKPDAESLIEDEELCQLHDLLALLRLGHIRVSEYENTKGRVVMVQINDSNDTPIESIPQAYGVVSVVSAVT